MQEPGSIVWQVLGLCFGFAGLLSGAQMLITGSKKIAKRFNLPDIVIGATLIALGTSAPELFVSVTAAAKGHPRIALGNVVGSNLCNAFLVLGIAALFVPITINRRRYLSQALWAMGSSLLVLALGVVGMGFSRLEGVLFISLLAVWTWRNLKKKDVPLQEGAIEFEKVPIGIAVFLVFLGLGFLLGGSELTVYCAVNIAKSMGIGERAIGISVVALGTSLPELVTSIIASLTKSPDIAVGTVLGSNIFNLLCIIGLSSLVAPFPVTNKSVVDLSLVAFCALSILIPVMARPRLGRLWGGTVVLIYFGYILTVFSKVF